MSKCLSPREVLQFVTYLEVEILSKKILSNPEGCSLTLKSRDYLVCAHIFNYVSSRANRHCISLKRAEKFNEEIDVKKKKFKLQI